MKYVFSVSVELLSETFLILERIQEGIFINVKSASREVPLYLSF